MRTPTPEDQIYAWWRDALVSPRLPRHDVDPQCGFYTRRAVKGGPLLPVHVFMEQEIDPETGELAADEVIRAEELGQPKDPVNLWTYLRPISREQYDALVERHRTDADMQATHVAMDIGDKPTRPGGYNHA